MEAWASRLRLAHHHHPRRAGTVGRGEIAPREQPDSHRAEVPWAHGRLVDIEPARRPGRALAVEVAHDPHLPHRTKRHGADGTRSEERRVGNECRSRWS